VETAGRAGATTIFLTAGLFHQMAQAPGGRLGELASLRRLVAGGDVLSASAVRRALEATAGVTVTNGYGPTEATVFTTFHSMTDPTAVGDPVPLGRPLANTRVHVLGPDRQPLPAGVWGELFVGGDGLARGYLGRPEVTAASFVPDPFTAGGPGSRLYATGDRARFLADGRLEFGGRRDGQVKMRGFRVELGEIESALERHAGVAAACVAFLAVGAGATVGSDGQQPAADDRHLVAYVVPAAFGEASPEGEPEAGLAAVLAAESAADLDLGLESELRRFLAAELPAAMMPSAFVRLAALPLTPNGKVDRAALAAPAGIGRSATEWVAPASELERLLAEIMAEVLHVERVGLRDNFFALGGHSLLATQLVSRLAQDRALPVTLQMVFDAADVGDLADRIVDRELASAGDDLDALLAGAGPALQGAPAAAVTPRRTKDE
jgi:acyl-CoA synthetase (AMP-forming)/AMP-acid ligase II